MQNKKPKTLPYYGKSTISEKVKVSSGIRKQPKLVYLLNRIWNRLLLILARVCPVNSFRITFHRWRGVTIGENVFIGMGVIIDRAYPEYITLEDNVMLAGDNHLLAHSRAPEFYKGKLLSYVAPITIKSYAWLGINSIILPGVTIGSGSVVTAGSVVSENIPDNVVARGNPAKVIKKFNE